MNKREILVGFNEPYDMMKDTIYLIVNVDINPNRHTYAAISQEKFKYHESKHVGGTKLLEGGGRPSGDKIGWLATEDIGNTQNIIDFLKDLEKENNATVNYDTWIQKTIEVVAETKQSMARIDEILKKYDEKHE